MTGTEATLYLFGVFALFCIGAGCLESWLDWRAQRKIARALKRLSWREPKTSNVKPWSGKGWR